MFIFEKISLRPLKSNDAEGYLLLLMCRLKTVLSISSVEMIVTMPDLRG